MKFPIIALPIVMQAALVAALYFAATSAPAPAPSPVIPATEIRQLHQERDQIEARLAVLESRTRVFVPRGMGNTQPTQPAQEIQ